MCSTRRRDEIFLIPDILCNSGGVIVSYFEWVQELQRPFWSEDEVNNRLTILMDRRPASSASRPPSGARAASLGVGNQAELLVLDRRFVALPAVARYRNREAPMHVE